MWKVLAIGVAFALEGCVSSGVLLNQLSAQPVALRPALPDAIVEDSGSQVEVTGYFYDSMAIKAAVSTYLRERLQVSGSSRRAHFRVMGRGPYPGSNMTASIDVELTIDDRVYKGHGESATDVSDSFVGTTRAALTIAQALNRALAAVSQSTPVVLGAPPPAPVAVASQEPPAPRPKDDPPPVRKTPIARSSSGLVALLPIDSKDPAIDRSALTTLEELIRTIAGDSMRPYNLTVLTGETTLGILRDNAVNVDTVCDASCALSAARELRARFFLSVTVTKSEGDYIAFVRLFESAGGQQLGSVHLEGQTMKELRRAFEAQAEKFFSRALDNNM